MSAETTLDLDRPLRHEDTVLEPGRYDVSVDETEGQLVLSRDEAEVGRLQAHRRASKMQVSRTTVDLRSVSDEPRRLLVIRTPPANEWVVSLDEVEYESPSA